MCPEGGPSIVQVPHAKELLGVRLVLWRNAQGAWSCFEDKCPHRLAPLSGMLLLAQKSSTVWQCELCLHGLAS